MGGSRAAADERTLREIYLRAWETTIRDAHPWSVMCANNPVNGVYSCENGALLHDMLEGEWGYDGVVGSDWAATHSAVRSVLAGLDQSFNWRDWGAYYRDLPALVRSGAVAKATINERVRRIPAGSRSAPRCRYLPPDSARAEAVARRGSGPQWSVLYGLESLWHAEAVAFRVGEHRPAAAVTPRWLRWRTGGAGRPRSHAP